MGEQLVCAVCHGLVPRGFPQNLTRTMPHPVCSRSHKIFMNARSYMSLEDLNRQWVMEQDQKTAIDRFLYGYARLA